MPQNPGQIMRTAILQIIFIILLACNNPFAPGITKTKQDGALLLTEQLTPEQALINFRYAYTFKDSLIYSDLLDSSFLFISKNFATDPVTDLTWGRDTDIKTTVGLFRHFQTLDLVWEGTVFERFLNPEKTLKEIKKSFKLTFDGGRDISQISGYALFIFTKKMSGAQGTTGIWKISRWEDVASF
jgi:hypothetical protein